MRYYFYNLVDYAFTRKRKGVSSSLTGVTWITMKKRRRPKAFEPSEKS